MLADPALGSTNMFRHKKWRVKIPTKFNWEKNNEIVSPTTMTRSANCSAFFIPHYCRTACLVAPHANASGRYRPISHRLFLIQNQRENSLLIFRRNRQMCSACAPQVVVDSQNKLLLEFHQLRRLTDISALRNFAVFLNEGNNFFTAGYTICRLSGIFY